MVESTSEEVMRILDDYISIKRDVTTQQGRALLAPPHPKFTQPSNVQRIIE